jgi:ketosteroid isomerase-like protein
MKIRLVVALTGLAISFALPTFAQQTNTPGPQLRQQILALDKKFDEAWTNNDAAAMAALYTEDAVIVRNDGGPIYGREAIEKYWADVFKTVHYSKHTSEPEQYSPHIIGTWGNQVWSTGEFSETLPAENGGSTQIKGHWLDIDVRESDALKFWVQTWNITPAPAATPSPMTTPSNK